MSIYLVALYKVQIIDGAAYYAQGENSVETKVRVPAARGNILDRYGRLLVSNSACNNLSINVTELFEQEDYLKNQKKMLTDKLLQLNEKYQQRKLKHDQQLATIGF